MGLGDLHSRWFGTWSLDDPRPIAASAPYTFCLPSQRLLDAVRPGDLVKAIFRPKPSNRNYDAERMWVTVAQLKGDQLIGELANQPFDMPQMKQGMSVTVPLNFVIDIDWAEGHVGPFEAPSREYWDRCMVDDCVSEGRSRVDYLYREEPDLGCDEDRYPDSGWRIRGTDEAIAADEAADRKPVYIAIGAVLNQDDSWIHLIDEPIGSSFLWDDARGKYEPNSSVG
ncbi:MAG: DUF2185 domain-containing protein [Proteobacteria bacterium]|nr:DUF2185 domain-containing protein [Pseudomonadota bacterium]